MDGVDGDSQVDGVDGDSQVEFWQNLEKKTDHDFPPLFINCGVGKNIKWKKTLEYDSDFEND